MSGVLRPSLGELYGGDGALQGMARQTFQVLEHIDARLKPDYAPAAGASYLPTHFGRSLREIAQLAKSDGGLEVACADPGGWDTYADQGAAEGALDRSTNTREYQRINTNKWE